MADNNSKEDIVIIIEDPVTGDKVKYKVSPDIAKGMKQLLDALERSSRGPTPSWDSACRV
ncbi:hypothetical protein ACOMICROBIO_GDFFDHBD_02964 [Vibrio sp. B1REV9]|uniref:hypothetical protein n=1 Tax=Vibrio sp. B1REV9 TaxID=2751179 RepID=UPI001AFBE960|nr:hypothetical protein [Vibrio sp. B1REV9]CAE6937072.1 hypothetical protein ACOMICROBIO_GDFFDHBD_02964 [Vibrio sp. B1REV9]